jgi:alkylation response protein AidB-like acyl-CoA dehydrogenase
MFLRAVVNEGALYNTAASEPGLGSPSRGGHFATRAVRDGDGWRINGRKAWTTLSPELAYVGVQLSLEEENGELSRATFLVPTNSPGFRIEETWDNLGMRASGSHDIVLENVCVPDAYRLPATGKPEGGPWSILTSAVYLGIGVAARDFAISFARDRRPTAMNGKAIAELQNVQHRIAQIEMLLLEARAALYATVETWQDQPELRAELGSQFAAAKVIVTNNAIDITDQALRVVGSVGLQRKHPLERYFRDARAGLGNPPMDDVAMTLIGKAALGVS